MSISDVVRKSLEQRNASKTEQPNSYFTKSYIDQLRSDINGLSSWKSQEELTELRKKFSTIERDLMQSGDSSEASKQLYSSVKSAKEYLDTISPIYSRYNSAEEFKKYSPSGFLSEDAETNETTTSLRKEWYQRNEDRIASIDEDLPWYANTWLPNFVEDIFLSDDKEALRDEAERLEAENNRYDRTQGVMDKYYTPVTDEFKQNAAYRDYSNASKEELWNYDMSTIDGSIALNDGGYFDDEGNIRDADGNIVQYANAPEVQDKLGMFLSAVADGSAMDYVGELSAANGNYTHTWGNLMQEGDTSGWRYLTEHEIDIYYDLYKREGQESAYKFLSDMKTELTRRETQERTDYINEAPILEQIALNIASIPMNVFGGVTSFVDDVSNVVQGEDINPYSRAHMFQNMASDIRQDTATDINNATGNASLPVVGTTWGDVYQSLMSAGDSLVGSAIGGTSYGVLMGMGAASAEMKELYEKGATTGQMVAGGLLAGAAEMVFEKYSIGEFEKLKSKDTKSVYDWVLNVLKQGGVEASEEMATEIANTITNSIVMGSQSDFEDMETFVKNVVNAGIGGFISGGAMGGVGSAIGGHQYNKQVKLHGQSIIDEGGVDPLKQLALDMYSDKSGVDAWRGVKSVSKVADKATAKNVGRLSANIEHTISAQNLSDVKSSLVEKGFSKKDANRIATYLVNGESLSKEQQADIKAEIKGNEKVAEVVNELLENPKSEINARAAQLILARAGFEYKREDSTVVSRGAEVTSVTENTTAKENATETKFEASTDGKTRVGDTEVSIKEIASVKDGEVILRLDDDSTVNASDVEYGSSAEALLYENVADMNLNAATANAFIKGYDPSMSADQYAKGFREAYRYGEYGFPVQEMSKDGFSAMLSESQKSLAYNLGKTDAKYKIDAKQKSVTEKASATVSKKEQVGNKNGRLHNTIAPTNDRQRASLKALKWVAETLGIDIYTYESAVVNGKRQGANGWFDPKDGSIHIDIHAGINGEGTMLFTAAHELTHFIREWSPAKFKVFADFLLEQYGKKGVSVDALVREQINKAKRNGRDISYDTAYEEVIADSCETMLADGDAITKIAELKAKDKTLWQKIKDFLTKLVTRIKSAYEGMTPDSVEGSLVSEMLDTAEKLKQMWTEALVEASDNYTSAEKTLFDSGIAVDSNTESASLMSVRDVLGDEQRQKVSDALATRFGVTKSEAMKWLDAETSLASLILNPKYSQYLDYTADANEEAIKSNSDYPQGTVDFSNICKKRRDFTEVMNRVLRNFPNHVFEATDLAKIRTIMMNEGMEVACGICYVEDRRQLDSVVAQDFIDSLALYREGSKTRPDGKPFNANQIKALKLIDGDSYIPSIYELISLEGRNSLKAKKPAMEEAWVKFNNARGMQSVRLLLNDAEYKRQILDYKPSVVKRKNDLGGLRIYSFSDAEMFHLIDIIQVITDSATVGLSLQGYTKVNEYAKAVKDTGEKLNRSLIPKGDLGYHMEDGKVVLDYDTVEGIDVNHPDFFDNIDNPNVGNILIGINKTQIKAAMVSKFVDQIIPFHTGQSNEVLGEKGIATWSNYKDFQSERDLGTGKKSAHQINIYTEVIQASEAEGHPITNKVEFVNKFLAVCKENNLEPRFSEFLNVDENGDYAYAEGYHKFLVDFKTFDQNTGEYLPQMPVKPIFDNEYITGLLKDYVKSQKEKDAKLAKSMPKVLDRITNEIVKPNEVKLSDRASYAPTFYSNMGKVVDGIKAEKVGANGVVPYLKGKGVKNEELKWSGIEAFLDGKKSVTKAELQEFVAGSQLQIVEQMSGGDIDLRYDGSNRAYTLHDSNGEVVDTFTYNEFLDGYVADSDEEVYLNDIELREALRGEYGANSAPKWEQYKLDGGSNYRELVFQLPNSTYSNRAMRVHWGQDVEGVLAHARIQDMTTADGKKMLFIEELQSDWHNEGHQKGYTTKEYEDAVAVYDKLAEDYANKRRAFNKYVRSSEFRSDPDEVSKKKFDWLRRKMDEAEKRMQAAERDIEELKKKGMGDVPDAPFRDTYHEYVLKRLLRMAAEEGYDSIGWTPADIQSKRWSYEYEKAYKIEYDQDIPSFLKKYGKKWGAQVGKTKLPSYNPSETYYDVNRQEEYKSFPVWQDMVRDELDAQGVDVRKVLFNIVDDRYWTAYDKVSGMEYDRAEIRKTSDSVWSMSIPDSMKDSVLHEGQVLYSDRSFASQVDDVLNGADTNSTHLKLMDTPSLLQEAGLPNLPILMTAKHLRTITSTSGKDKVNYHGLDVEIVKKLPKYISSPVMIADSFTKNDSVVIITEAIDSQNKPVIAAILLNGSGRVDGKHINANIMTSAYGKDNFQSFLERIVDSDSVIYWNEKKSQDLSVSLGLQLPNAITSLRSGVIIHQAKAFVNTQNEKTLYSDRDTDSVSNRSLLANALESVAQNDIERNKLKEYKGKIALIESEQAKLAEVREKIKELSFAKGRRDTEAIKSLQFEANQTANRINTYDKQLLNLESTKALKDVLQREKQMAYKRAEQRGKDALAAYRERATKTQRELMTRYQESRKKGVESRHKTAMRHKIKDVVSELNQYLLQGTKDKHVPIELQKAVAEALDAVNMDTVGAEERLAKIHEQLQKDPFNHELLESYRRISEQGERMDGKLQALKNAYDEIVNSDDPLIANSHDEVISNSIAKVINEVGSTPLRDMTLTQLESVYDMYKMVLTTVRNTNKAFKAAKSEEISVIANRVMEEIDSQGNKKIYMTKASQFANKFAWNNLKPVYAFERIGSNTFTDVFNNVRSAEDTWAVDLTQAKEFSEAQRKKYDYGSWDFKKRYDFTSSSGKPFELSLDQIMSLYAYSKREQARDHLNKGGIVIDETTEVTVKNKLGIPIKFNPTQATAYNLSDETLADIIGKLTTEQKEFVDVMQDYLSTTMGEKGNEVSLELYGVKLYKEKNYFPLKSATQFMAKAKEQQKGEVKVKNSGFSKETTPKASNPIVLTPFMDVWADHVNDMSMYHAFVLPLEDFYRVYNYKTPTSDTMATESVEMYLQNAFGKGATQYIDQLLKDLNGGARVDSTAGIINKMTGLFKKSAVFASASVVVQQPSAIARATALVDTKYFVGKPSKTKHSETWAEVKKYAPVAIIKEMGYFDTGMGQSTVEWLKGDKTWKDKLDDIASKAPSLADELAWCGIWKAVKRETLYTHKDLKPNSEEFLKAVGERFTEVITKTQVYDSVLARSANMRSKDTGMKMVTAFMGEPTTSINMIENALVQGKRGNKRYARKAIGSVISSMIINSILVSFVYAGRDDDEDKTYGEKYLATLTEELIDSFNPLTLVPFVKDIVSIVQGYDVERSDMAVITDIVNAWNNLSNDNRSVYRKVEDFAGAIASIFGLPVKNIMRDVRGIYNTVNSFINGEDTTGAGIGVAVTEAVTGKEKSNGQQLYEAMLAGDTAQIERVKGRFEDESSMNSAIRSSIKEAYTNGDIDYETAMEHLIEYGGMEDEDEAYWVIDKWNHAVENGSSEDYSKYGDFYTAVETGKNLKAVIKEYQDNGVSEETLQSQITSHFKDTYASMSKSKRASLKGYLRNAMTCCGMTTEEANARLQYWDFLAEYPQYEELTESAVTKYYESVEPYGISVDVYFDYTKQRAKCEGVDANGDGKADSGTVKSQAMAVIHSMPLTSQQKDALYFLNGWSASTLWQAPWH